MSSDSSDDEDAAKLREAADFQFINDTMFNGKQVDKEQNGDKLQSLRPSKDEDEQFNFFHVSAEFRTYVAKHLTAILDKKLLYKTQNYNNTKPKRRKTGIKLFHNSPHYIKTKIKEKNTQVVKHQPEDADESGDEEKCKSVAVNPEDILSRKEVKHWSNRSKALIYTYIKTENGLILK